MPSLNWIGKEVVVNHDKEVPFKLLRKVKSVSVGNNSQNLIIHGDNLEALKALMPYYKGKIKCIYIDPPYNTGNEKWVYNDNVNSPKIKKWLGKTVGAEGEDLTRHDKWLCMIYPRLKLLKDLLSDEGVIFVSIDDSEQANIRLILDEIFGYDNFIATFVRKSGVAPRLDAKHISKEHDYILCYSKNESKLKLNKVSRELDTSYRLEDKHVKLRGKYKLNKLDRGSIRYSEKSDYPIVAPDKTLIYPGGKKEKNGWTWRWSEKKLDWGIKNDFIVFKKSKKGGSVYFKQYQYVDNEGNQIKREIPFKTLLLEHYNEMANRELKNIFKDKKFNYPKPLVLLKDLISIISSPNDIILDSFAGSGTTGHASLDLNKEDKGNRKFILIEMENDIAKTITAERIKRAIKKYDYKDGFEFCELDKSLFDENGQIDESCTFEQLATYIYFIETKTNIDKKKVKSIFIGDNIDTEYYLIFEERNHNILSGNSLKSLNKNNKKKVIYADQCLLSDEYMEKNNIIFKQIPYEIEK